MSRHCRTGSPGIVSSNESGIPTTLASSSRAPPSEMSRTVQPIVAVLRLEEIFAPLSMGLRAVDLSFCAVIEANIRGCFVGFATIQRAQPATRAPAPNSWRGAAYRPPTRAIEPEYAQGADSLSTRRLASRHARQSAARHRHANVRGCFICAPWDR